MKKQGKINNKTQLTSEQKALLEKQQYRIIGSHSAVKVCGWTKNAIGNYGHCYKQDFYGIRSHQCLQMTTSLYCANRCTFCWRDFKAPTAKKWHVNVDAPEFIIDNSISSHIKLLQGFKGFKQANKIFLSEMSDVRHVALSLTGEPITYPKINQLIKELHKRKISTFLVTNAQFPEQMKKIKNITQLYMSLDAPTKELMKKIDCPLFPDFWNRTIKSLKILSTRNYRTAIRLTLIKGLNMEDNQLKDYADLIKLGNPDFVEVKSYMWVGASQKNFKISDMPRMEEIKSFTKKLLKLLPEYEASAEHIPSRVTLIMKKSLKKKRYIDFNKFFNIVNNNKKLTKDSYSSSKLI